MPTSGLPPASPPPLPPRSQKRGNRRPTLSSPEPRGGKRRPLLKALLWFIVLIVLAVLAYVGYLAYKVNEAIEDAGADVPNAAAKPVDVKPVTVLLLGVDTRPKGGSLNTDVILVASLNPERKSAAVVSIPRDTQIKLSGYSVGKANSYYAAFRNANASTADAKTKALFGKYLNVPIDYVVRIGFDGFEDVVDKLGGLTLDVDMNMCYRDRADGTSIDLSAGTHHLTGKETLDFIRYRKGNCKNASDSDDIARNVRQEQVIDAVLGKLKSLEGLLKLGQVVESVGQHVESDIPAAQIRNFIGTYMGIDRDKINYVHLQGEWHSPYIIVRPDELKQAQAALQEQLK